MDKLKEGATRGNVKGDGSDKKRSNSTSQPTKPPTGTDQKKKK